MGIVATFTPVNGSMKDDIVRRGLNPNSKHQILAWKHRKLTYKLVLLTRCKVLKWPVVMDLYNRPSKAER